MANLPERLLERLAHVRPFRAIIVGDFMLDEHLHGDAERLSPDAPVPVIVADHDGLRSMAGGASNVATCLGALGGTALCAGVTGADAPGATLRRILEQGGADTSLLVEDPGRPTTVKRSIVGLAQHRHPQKMFRLDFESRAALPAALEERLLARLEAALPGVDVVCIEDYEKGVCTPSLCQALVRMCRSAGKPLLVDPAASADYSRYRGATAITPNRTEAERATGLPTPREFSVEALRPLAERLLTDLQLEAVVLTLDRHGALLVRRDEAPLHVPTVARTVYDVTGAGDMVLAALAAGVANGIAWPEAVAFANAAAGLEVEVFGTQPIPLSRVRQSVLSLARGEQGKVRTLEDLEVELAVHREAGRRVVLTNGCFDVLHAGHVAYLREAKRQGDVLVVGVNDDEQVRRMKGAERPIFPLQERLEVLDALECVDYLVPFAEPTAHTLIRRIHPEVYAKGGDYRPQDLNEWDLIQELRLDLRILSHRPGRSSTGTIARLRQSEKV